MYLLGDIHGYSGEIINFVNSKEKYCIQLGDFGFIFSEIISGDERLKIDLIQEYLAKKDKILFTILGNHDCWPYYYNLDVVYMFGAKCWKVTDNIYAIIPGEIIEIENKTFLCIGGANSMDIEWRLRYKKDNGIDIWWEEEEISESDIENAMRNLEKVNYTVDYVCTHCEPETFCYKYFDNHISSASEKRLDKILDIVNFNKWFGGHIHMSCDMEICGKKITTLGIDEKIIV